MSGRCFLIAILLLALPGAAHAHRLDADFRLLDNQQVQVEAWFGDGEPARKAHVHVTRSDGSTISEGETDDKGIFVFTCSQMEPMRVVVYAGAGHRKELTITAKAGTTAAGEKPAERQSLIDHRTETSWRDVLTGVSCLLALAAFVLSLRNAQELRRARSR